MKSRLLSPGSWLLMALLFVALLMSLIVVLVLRQPTLGLSLQPDTVSGQLQITAVHGPAAGLPLPATLQALRREGRPDLPLTARDLVEEPDTLQSYEEVRELLARQALIQSWLDGLPLQLVLETPEGEVVSAPLQPEHYRSPASLPLAFWIQLLAGAGGFLIGTWIVVLRPRDGAARCFALSGVALMLSAFAAAVYSVRELSVPAELFRGLMIINHLGSTLFGCALLALFLLFPKRLLRPVWLWLLPAIFLPWLILDSLQLWPDPATGMYLPVMLQTLGILLLILLQWWHNRGQPLALASLRWLGLSSLLTASLFVLAAALPALLNQPPLMSQGHAFGLFLILYTGLALGLRRYRLFDLDRWAFHLLLWLGTVAALLVLDLALILLLRLDQTLSLALSLLACSLLWLPLRHWLLARLLHRSGPGKLEIFRQVLDISLAATPQERLTRHRALLTELFHPLQLENHAGVTRPHIAENGLALLLPGAADIPALKMAYAHGGRRLFTPQDFALATEMQEMLRHADASRDAYNQGVREERSRIARDLHDDIGSRLLTGLHQSGITETRQSIQQAITEMRTIINGLTGTQMQLDVMLAELRHETSLRLEAAGLTLEWPLLREEDNTLLPYRVYRNYSSVMRELISNILRHAGASHVQVAIRLQENALQTRISDNGVGMPEEKQQGRQGLANLHSRISDMQGSLSISSASPGTCMEILVPLAPVPPAAVPAPAGYEAT
ncbi:MAG: ATP-binding protein [Pedobacter sp.]|nr:ATP-binding protein [Pedobacter sp.]